MPRRTVPPLSALLLALLTGCLGPTFETMPPRESLQYGADLLGEPPQGSWYWVRGRIRGDLDVSEGVSLAPLGGRDEVLLVTRQEGDPAGEAGPAREAWVLLVRIQEETRQRVLVEKEQVYQAGKTGALPQPQYTFYDWPDQPLTEGLLTLTDMEGDGHKEVLVSLWHPHAGGVAAVHRLLAVREEGLEEIFVCRAVQEEATVREEDLDRDGILELVVPVRILPPRKDAAPLPRPVWPVVYARNSNADYTEAPGRFPAVYQKALLGLYEDYLLQTAPGQALPRSPHALYLGLIYRYRRQTVMARRWLQRAADGEPPHAAAARGAQAKVPAPGREDAE